MGDPRSLHRKYSKPAHPWQKDRIEQEKLVVREYGLKNKTEVYKITSTLRNAMAQTKKLIALHSPQAEKEKKQLIKKLADLGLITSDAKLDDILSLTIQKLLDRRLQTIVFKKGLARTVIQARQFITHEHIKIGKKTITSPAYLVTTIEETNIEFNQNSPYKNNEHPERAIKPKTTTTPEKTKVAEPKQKEKGATK